jgi:hypothetical protein
VELHPLEEMGGNATLLSNPVAICIMYYLAKQLFYGIFVLVLRFFGFAGEIPGYLNNFLHQSSKY